MAPRSTARGFCVRDPSSHLRRRRRLDFSAHVPPPGSPRVVTKPPKRPSFFKARSFKRPPTGARSLPSVQRELEVEVELAAKQVVEGRAVARVPPHAVVLEFEATRPADGRREPDLAVGRLFVDDPRLARRLQSDRQDARGELGLDVVARRLESDDGIQDRLERLVGGRVEGVDVVLATRRAARHVASGALAARTGSSRRCANRRRTKKLPPRVET
mmetsp:Transcript_8296/g.34170  ORF Transcript_8296/g.34170 Transcript_8296/m.34170 type:complete len:216 (+) Transcript_8296:77-724(+)